MVGVVQGASRALGRPLIAVNHGNVGARGSCSLLGVRWLWMVVDL